MHSNRNLAYADAYIMIILTMTFLKLLLLYQIEMCILNLYCKMLVLWPFLLLC